MAADAVFPASMKSSSVRTCKLKPLGNVLFRFKQIAGRGCKLPCSMHDSQIVIGDKSRIGAYDTADGDEPQVVS